jgi:mycoredoxin
VPIGHQDPTHEERAPVSSTAANPNEIVMYSTTWCGYCRQLKRQFVEHGIAFSEINIEQVPGTAEFVMSVNGGDQTVPTVLFPDGSTLTNPSLAQVRARLDAAS